MRGTTPPAVRRGRAVPVAAQLGMTGRLVAGARRVEIAGVPDDQSPTPPTPPADAVGTPPDEPPSRPPIPERPIPRGCNPLVFGVVMATIQFGATLYFMRSC